MIQFDKFFDPKSTTKQFDNFFDQKMFVLNLVLWQSILTENMNFLIFQYFWTIQSKFFKSFQRNETPKNQNATVLHYLTVDNLNLARKNVKILWLKKLVKLQRFCAHHLQGTLRIRRLLPKGQGLLPSFLNSLSKK